LQHIGREVLALGLGQKRPDQPLARRSRSAAGETEVTFYTMPTRLWPSIRAYSDQGDSINVSSHALRKIAYWREEVLVEHKVTLEALHGAAIEMWIGEKRVAWWKGGGQGSSRWAARLLPPEGIGALEGFVGPTHVEAIKIGTRTIARIVLFLARKVASRLIRRSGIRALFARRT
jgi:hypothetical protein